MALSAAVCTKGGKPLVARQFVEMPRVRIEGLLAAFPKLMGSGQKSHTFVETENVRYVYHPLENMYLLLITNKSSNIVEDLETLRLLSAVVKEYCEVLNEEGVSDAAFELVFAFDEVINLGLREPVTLAQIRTNMEMDSQEEKLHNMIKASKEEETKLEMKRRADQIKKQKAEQRRQEKAAGKASGSRYPGGGPQGFGGGMGAAGGGMQNHGYPP